MRLGFAQKARPVVPAVLSLGLACALTLAANADDTDIVINEIMYNPPSWLGSDEDYEYIELFNRGVIDVDISGCASREPDTHSRPAQPSPHMDFWFSAAIHRQSPIFTG